MAGSPDPGVGAVARQKARDDAAAAILRSTDALAGDLVAQATELRQTRRAREQAESELAAAREALRAHAAVHECPGVLVDEGVTSGCTNAARGLDDCPTCHATAAALSEASSGG